MRRMQQPPRVYLDYAATTPLAPRAWEAMSPFFTEIYGYPSSAHFFGQQAESAVENSRRSIAAHLGCSPDEIVFTSGGTESDNLALRGIAFTAQRERGAAHILISPIEHPAVQRTAEQLASVFGFTLELLPVDSAGMVNPDDVRARLRTDTALVSVIHASNEIGTIQPLAEIGAVCRSRGIPLHTDSVQAASQLGIRVDALNVDSLSFCGHKLYGPKGIGALYLRRGTALQSAQTGGSHETSRRAGTSNVPLIVGFADAFALAVERFAKDSSHFQSLRDRLITGVLASIPNAALTGHAHLRLPNHASFVFQGVKGNHLTMNLDIEGFALSSGSACKTGDPEPSEILLSLGLSREWAFGALRATVGRPTTIEDVDRFLAILPAVIAKRRALEVS
jgi:cysteine desulfurase